MSRTNTPSVTTSFDGLASPMSQDNPKLHSPRNGVNSASSPWHTVLDMCKKGFANKMEMLASEIIHDVKEEVQASITVLKRELTNTMISRESPLLEELVTLSATLHKVEEATSIPPPVPPDIGPLFEQMQITAKAQEDLREQLRAMELRIDKMMVMTDDVVGVEGETNVVVSRMEEKLLEMGRQVESTSKVSASMSTTVDNILEEVVSVQKKQVSQEAVLEKEVLGISRHLQNATFNVDLKEVHQDICESRRTFHADVELLLSEVSRIQKAMEIDFVQLSHGEYHQEAVHKSRSKHGMPRPRSRPGSRPGSARHHTSPHQVHSIQDQVAEAVKALGDDTTIPISERHRTYNRELGVQTSPDQKEMQTQTDPNMFIAKDPKKNKDRGRKAGPAEEAPPDIGGHDKLAQQAREASMRPAYNVFDYYKETGFFQWVAKSDAFDRVTFCTVLANAVWLSVDADYNNATIITDASPVFFVAENIFCTIFFSELLIRFCAFQRKRHAFRDTWFVFDLILVILMVAETWVVAILVVGFGIKFPGGAGTLSVLRMVRIIKLLKLGRLTKVLHAFPELIIITKGLLFASRSVLIFFSFCILIIYVFAIALRSTMDGHPLGATYFHSVPASMNTLLLTGIFPSMSSTVNEMTDSWWVMWPIMVIFLLIISITVMYMLVGVLVDVVGVVSSVEKESLTVAYVSSEFRSVLIGMGFDLEDPITKTDVERIVIDPRIAAILTRVGVDVDVFCGMLDIIFEDIEKKGAVGIQFTGLIDVILNMRGSNPSTVKDSKESLRILKTMLVDLPGHVAKKMRKEFEELKLDLQDIREDIKEADGRGESRGLGSFVNHDLE